MLRSNRFGRDYYINQSKVASGEQSERARSAMSSSSRPSSSLSQRSSCAGDEQRERQVSHELERFEASSLHSSLPRRRCRDPRASSHFAINPLLHLEVAQSPVSDESNTSAASSAVTTAAPSFPEGKNVADLRRLWIEVEEPIMSQYSHDSREGSPGDRDSGMCSIGSRDSEVGSERDRWRRLCSPENGDQISSVGGRKFWTIAHKYHTFGGIKIQLERSAEDLEDLENLDDLDDEPDGRLAQSDHAPEFVRFKYQTFGGIKKSRRIRPRLRIPSKVTGKSHGSSSRVQPERSAGEERPEHLLCSSSLEPSTSSAFEESDWQDEEDDVVDDRVATATRRKNANSSSLTSAADKIIMDKFLRDVSKRRKASAFSDNVAMSRGRRIKSRRRREISEEGADGKLEKSTSGSNGKSSESLKGSRRARERKNDSKRRCDKMDVRSLSDVTIW